MNHNKSTLRALLTCHYHYHKKCLFHYLRCYKLYTSPLKKKIDDKLVVIGYMDIRFLVMQQFLNLIFLLIFLQRHRRSPHIWYHLLPAVTSALLIGRIISSTTIFVSAQCFGGVETYEKTSGTTVVCAENECTSRGLLTQPDTSVTRDCIAICKQSSNCNSFTVGKKNMLIFGCKTNV